MKDEKTSLDIVIVCSCANLSVLFLLCVDTVLGLRFFMPIVSIFLHTAERNKYQADSSGTCGWPEHMLQDPMEARSQVASDADPLRDLSTSAAGMFCE